jgi:hypothetical protein
VWQDQKEVQATAPCDDQHAIDLDIYLSQNIRFKSTVYDRREIRCIADNLGCAPDWVRSQLRKSGYCLIKNNHGQMVWKRNGASL